MSLHRTLVTVVISLCAFALGSAAHAQKHEFLRKADDNSDFTGLYDPFCDLDTAWFEPINCDCPDERPINSGWFFSYSRTNLNVSRPRDENPTLFYDPEPGIGGPLDVIPSIYTGSDFASDYQGDWSWGNRFDFGWISEDGSGLWIVARKLDSPDKTLQFDNIDLNNDDSVRPDGEPWGPTFVTLNGMRMWGVELNKIWRLDPTPKGTVIEPFLGPRYIRLRDHANRDDVFTNAADQLRFSDIGAANTSVIERIDFNFRESVVTTDNDLFGGQLGIRTRCRRGRWQITSDLRGLAFWNHQNREIRESNEAQAIDWIATYNAAGQLTTVAPLNGVVTQEHDQTNNYDSHNTFVYGGELNVQAAFEITQGFALTASGEIVVLGDGVGRGRTRYDDSLVMSGFSFGFTVNR